jgi:hypothetical protein
MHFANNGASEIPGRGISFNKSTISQGDISQLFSWPDVCI